MNAPLLLLVIVISVAADQMTKALALALLSAGMPISILPGFNLTLGYNEGASFGMLAPAHGRTDRLVDIVFAGDGISVEPSTGTGRICSDHRRVIGQYHRSITSRCGDRLS